MTPTHVTGQLSLPLTMISLAVFLPLLIASSGCQMSVITSVQPVVRAAAAPSPTPEPSIITMAAVGDIMLGSPFPNDTRMPPNDGADLLKDVTPLLSAADIAFGNMEGPITDTGISEKCKPPTPAAVPTPTPTPLPSATPKKPEPVRCY